MKKNINDSVKLLKKLIKKDSEIIVALHSVSTSGMTRKMSIYAIENKRLRYLNHAVSDVTSFKRDKNNHLIVGGCGMDMCFHLTYSIKQSLYPKAKFEELTQSYQLIS